MKNIQQYEIYLTSGMFGKTEKPLSVVFSTEAATLVIEKWKKMNKDNFKIEPYNRFIKKENGDFAVDFGDYSSFMLLKPVEYGHQTFQILYNENKSLFLKLLKYVSGTTSGSVSTVEYTVDTDKWTVFDAPTWKITENKAGNYHFFFNKTDGFTLRFGSTLEEDPEFCALGPEIMDIEVVAGKCPKINGKNCAFCYKNNGGDIAKCMTLEQFKHMFQTFPKNLTQIAFGITGYYTNPEYGEIMQYAKDNGVIPNYTTNGVDLDEKAINHTLDCCGRVAVSCYDGAKEICYNTIKKFGEAAKKRGMKFPCNIHLVVSKQTINHVMDVLNDAKNGVIENLGSIVLLRMKPVGRAEKLDSSVPIEMYREIVKFCMDSNISFGFDSCGAKSVEKVLREMNRNDLISSVEPCESTRCSIYISCEGKMTPCSFCEHVLEKSAIDVNMFADSDQFINTWNNNSMLTTFRTSCIKCDRSCQMYDLD